jgi:Tfp pilus assembly protein PilO
MEQFNKLPFQQKVAVLVGVMVMLGGLFYYTMLIPIDDEAAQNETSQKRLEVDLKKLKDETKGYKDIDFKAETVKLNEEKAHFEDLLPPREELVEFITGLSEIAKGAGLTLIRFEKREAQERHFYQAVPIEMEVLGTYREIIGFIRAVADKDRRVINIRGLDLKTTDINIIPILFKYSQQRLARYPPGTNTLKPLSMTQKFMWRVKAYEEAIASGLDLSAKFTAEVFVYTGKKASAGTAAELAREALGAKKLREKYVTVTQ